MPDEIDGVMSVYLEGRGAILDLQLLPDRLEGFVGGKESLITIVDFRENTLYHLQPKQSYRDLSPFSFADIFNLPANISIEETCGGSVTITLRTVAKTDTVEDKQLWLGVIRNQKMPVQKFLWEILKPVLIDEESVIAFAAVIEWTKR